MKKTILSMILLLLSSVPALAGDPGLHIAVGGMAFTNSSKQGGQGPSGSTILTHHDLVYHGPWWGIGAFAQFDKQGSAETDFAVGPKIELHWSVFYLEGGYSVLMQRSFTDRSISKQTGDGWLTGIGARFPLSFGGQGGGGGGQGGGMTPFLQFSYKMRWQIVRKQDGALLDDKITQQDGYPVFGIGMKF